MPCNPHGYWLAEQWFQLRGVNVNAKNGYFLKLNRTLHESLLGNF